MGMELPTRQTPADQVRELMTRKDAIEAQIEAQASILRANNCTMQTRLVDAEGFPRADIDIYEVRHAHVRLIELRNDHKAVTDAIYKGLQGVYDPSLPASAPEPTAETLNSSELRPFAKVDGVAPGSPAAAAGLLREDLILSFGGLTRSSFSANSLQPLATLVAANEGRELAIKVLRSVDQVTLTFTPRRGWGGRGLLGCHIVPHTQ